MRKRRIASLVLAALMILALCSCGQRAEAATWQEKYDLGAKYLDEGNYEEAVFAFTAAIEIDPKRPAAYTKLAEAYLGQGDPDAARETLQQGVDATGDESLQTRLKELSDYSDETETARKTVEGYPKEEKSDTFGSNGEIRGYAEYEYNAYADLVKVSFFNADDSIENYTEWEYDGSGYVMKETSVYPNFNEHGAFSTVQEIDAQGRITLESTDWYTSGDETVQYLYEQQNSDVKIIYRKEGHCELTVIHHMRAADHAVRITGGGGYNVYVTEYDAGDPNINRNTTPQRLISERSVLQETSYQATPIKKSPQ